MKKHAHTSLSNVVFVRKPATACKHLITFVIDSSSYTLCTDLDGAGNWISIVLLMELTCFVSPPLEKSFLFDIDYGVAQAMEANTTIA